MKTPKPIKGFDAVSFKHDAALRIYKQIKGMTPRQEVEFWKQAKPIRIAAPRKP
jgi:hypothetical protein